MPLKTWLVLPSSWWPSVQRHCNNLLENGKTAEMLGSKVIYWCSFFPEFLGNFGQEISRWASKDSEPKVHFPAIWANACEAALVKAGRAFTMDSTQFLYLPEFYSCAAHNCLSFALTTHPQLPWSLMMSAKIGSIFMYVQEWVDHYT